MSASLEELDPLQSTSSPLAEPYRQSITRTVSLLLRGLQRRSLCHVRAVEEWPSDAAGDRAFSDWAKELRQQVEQCLSDHTSREVPSFEAVAYDLERDLQCIVREVLSEEDFLASHQTSTVDMLGFVRWVRMLVEGAVLTAGQRAQVMVSLWAHRADKYLEMSYTNAKHLLGDVRKLLRQMLEDIRSFYEEEGG